jgi:hypothetical protein
MPCDLVRLIQGFDFELFCSPQLEIRRLALAVSSFLISTLDLKTQDAVIQKEKSVSADQPRPEVVRVAGPFVRSGTLTFLTFDSSVDTSVSSKYMYSAQSKQDRKLFSYLLRRMKDNFPMIIGVGYDRLNDILQHHRLLDCLPDIKGSTVFVETRSLGNLVNLTSASYDDWRTEFIKNYPLQDPRIKYINRLLSKRSVIALPPMHLVSDSSPSIPRRHPARLRKEDEGLLLSSDYKKSSTCIEASKKYSQPGQELLRQKTSNMTLSTTASKSPRGRGDRSDTQDRLSPKTPTRSISRSNLKLLGGSSLPVRKRKHQNMSMDKNPNFRLSKKTSTGSKHQSSDKPDASIHLGSTSFKLTLNRLGTRNGKLILKPHETETLPPKIQIFSQPEQLTGEPDVKDNGRFFCKVRKTPKLSSQVQKKAGLTISL